MTKLDELITQRNEIDKQISDLLKEEAEQSPHKDVGINDMTPELWRSMLVEEKRAWKNYWKTKGQVSFSCLSCGFPTVAGQVSCESCNPIQHEE